ncbi:elongation of very long chain fatty acids protein 4-like [Drosophila ficusphila]|uniref:elongation of very long chain fatty acids protein 4-like n=1 Tax=Drosophila ficusphila TaxID=30025 RepID=UPI0007E85D72|nr:elongation of very long chain fatty acids protein 4-like [Drosophila ficusphila]
MVSDGISTEIGNYSFPYEELADARTRPWLLVESPWNIAALLAFYLLMVLYGPKWAARRKPMKLRVPLFCHSVAMALLNAHICLELFTATRALDYSFGCQPCRVSYNPHEMRIAAAFWWFYFSKLLEFADTAFFILRHKWTQLSFLHVYHHSTMFLMTWVFVKWKPTGSSYFPAMMNSFVHIIMYSYYALSVLGPRVQRFLWWKRYLTALQLLQFTVGIIWTSQMVIRGCEYGTWLSAMGGVYTVPFLFLFGRFYAKNYSASTEVKKPIK